MPREFPSPRTFFVAHTNRGYELDDKFLFSKEDGSVDRLESSSEPPERLYEVLEGYCLFGYICGMLLVVTDLELGGELHGSQYYRVKRITAINIRCQHKYAEKVIRKAVSMLTPGLYFSPTADLAERSFPESAATSEQQKQMFRWNFASSRSLVEAGLSPYVPSFIFGFVGSWKVGPLKMSIVSRRRTDRAGFRFTTRGLDSDGAVAMAAETMTSIQLDDKIFSFTIFRGSIPQFWLQRQQQWKKPQACLYEGSLVESRAFASHFETLAAEYGKPIIALSTVKGYGMEQKLNMRYQQSALKDKNVTLFKHWSFYKKSSDPVEKRMEALYDELRDHLGSIGLTESSGEDGKLFKSQSGLLRVNCIDCCDRTNIIQSFITLRVLKEHIQAPPGVNWKDIEAPLRQLWMENGNALSMQYAGGKALRGDATAQGRRTLGGILSDIWSLMGRAVRNKYSHPRLQDGVDLILGVARMDGEEVKEPSSFYLWIPTLSLVLFLASLGGRFLTLPTWASVLRKAVNAFSFVAVVLVYNLSEEWFPEPILDGTKDQIDEDERTYSPIN